MNAMARPETEGGQSPALAAFDWADPFLLRDQLSEEERLIADAASEYCQGQLMPKIIEANRHEKFDRGIFQAFGELGFLGVTIPEEYGCAGASYVSYGLIAREVERVDSGYRSAMSVQSSLVMHPIYAYGDETQRKTWLPRLASGELVGCFGLTEPDHGSDPGGMKHPRQARSRAATVLSGAKMWITNSPVADICHRLGQGPIMMSFAASSWNAACQGPGKTPKIEGKFSASAPPSTGMKSQMDEVFVPDEPTYCPAWKGLKGPFGCLNRARYGIAWGRDGRRRVLLARRPAIHPRPQAVRQAARRQTQLFQKKLADMQTEITLGLQCCPSRRPLMDEGKAAPEMISLVKRNNCGKALDIARNGPRHARRQRHSDEYQVIRHMMNLETVNTYEGTHDIHALILGRAQTGIQAFM